MRISDWSSDVCSSDLQPNLENGAERRDLLGARLNDEGAVRVFGDLEQGLPAEQADEPTIGDIADANRAVGVERDRGAVGEADGAPLTLHGHELAARDRKSTRLNSSH